jgi:hypothetical protein
MEGRQDGGCCCRRTCPQVALVFRSEANVRHDWGQAGPCSKAERANFLEKMAEQTPAILSRRIALALGAQGKNAQSHRRNVTSLGEKVARVAPGEVHLPGSNSLRKLPILGSLTKIKEMGEMGATTDKAFKAILLMRAWQL